MRTTKREWRWPSWVDQIIRHDKGDKDALSFDSDRIAILLTCLFLVPHIVALLVSLRSPIYAERSLIWTTLPYFVLVAAGIRIIGGSLRKGVMNILSLRRRASLAGLVSMVRLGAQLLVLAAILRAK